MNYIWVKVLWKNGFEHQYQVLNTKRAIASSENNLEGLRWVDSFEFSDKKFKGINGG